MHNCLDWPFLLPVWRRVFYWLDHERVVINRNVLIIGPKADSESLSNVLQITLRIDIHSIGQKHWSTVYYDAFHVFIILRNFVIFHLKLCVLLNVLCWGVRSEIRHNKFACWLHQLFLGSVCRPTSTGCDEKLVVGSLCRCKVHRRCICLIIVLQCFFTSTIASISRHLLIR